MKNILLKINFTWLLLFFFFIWILQIFFSIKKTDANIENIKVDINTICQEIIWKNCNNKVWLIRNFIPLDKENWNNFLLTQEYIEWLLKEINNEKDFLELINIKMLSPYDLESLDDFMKHEFIKQPFFAIRWFIIWNTDDYSNLENILSTENRYFYQYSYGIICKKWYELKISLEKMNNVMNSYCFDVYKTLNKKEKIEELFK